MGVMYASVPLKLMESLALDVVIVLAPDAMEFLIE